ncbi:catechol 2,3-dioxygenase-like lactoylglutathione lyase family enzyme [Variovorax boronicumulans]|uniref:VOC family protein n=1 Tax=Variovorax boronicumulans TaxID=436515 RepID=UPI002789EDEB|nr:VOC family protein [Variovorax boronicumulans]MDQ0072326.1 catechol 2,3-dioxygenase-like lactoylglutathione lyase family enzyme [Variovorax boronicumulans]
MIDHIGFRVRDLHASRRFYEAVAASVGLQVIDNSDTSFLVIRSTDERIPFVWVGTEEPKFWKPGHRVSNSPIHLAFSARSTADVDAFHKAALQAGGTDNGKPGPRGPAEAHYYGAYVLDPDGNNIEAGFRGAA